MSATTARAVQAPILTIGRGGWSLHFPTDPRPGYGQSTLSHYGESWREHLDDMTADVIGTDCRDMADIVTFAVSGPMVCPDLPAGMVRGFSGVRAFDSAPVEGRDPRFGNARGLDYVAIDVYVSIVRAFGGIVFDPRES